LRARAPQRSGLEAVRPDGRSAGQGAGGARLRPRAHPLRLRTRRATKTAYEAHEERAGVCRDYAHLAITLCRALNIPARYCTGYLGDIRVEAVPGPMDFSAWFEVWLGGAWRAADARHNQPAHRPHLMGVGRDAADVAITTTFGPANLAEFTVFTDEVV
jgi:transglutaminase-like putative cysteine protease